MKKRITNQTNNNYSQIDNAIKDIQDNDQQKKDEAGLLLIELFNPLVKSVSTKIVEKHKHFNYQDIETRVQYILIIMAMDFRKPRTDTRAAGRTRGEWAPNFNIYAKQNLYYFTIVDLMKENDNIIDNVVVDNGSAKSYSGMSSFVKENIDKPKNTEYLKVINILSKIEEICGERARDVMMLKSIFGFNASEVGWVAGISKNSVKSTVDKVIVRMKKHKYMML